MLKDIIKSKTILPIQTKIEKYKPTPNYANIKTNYKVQYKKNLHTKIKLPIKKNK